MASLGETCAGFPREMLCATPYVGEMIETTPFSLDASGDTAHLSAPLFSIQGIRQGPRLVATAPDALARRLAERFWDLTSLGQMWGSFVLRSDTQDPAFDLPDAILTLSDLPENEAYFQVLRSMAELGMISGRGVPQRKAA